jgi:uncharacterized protein YndB with AHSA1/START domain
MKNSAKDNNYHKEISVNSSTSEVFSALTQKLHLWWGKTDKPVHTIGDEFTIYFGVAFWSFKITEYVPNSKLTWECIGGKPDFNAEWIGDVLYWTIKETDTATLVRLLQVGLTPDMNCYDICAPTWDKFIMISLKSFVENGVAKTF